MKKVKKIFSIIALMLIVFCYMGSKSFSIADVGSFESYDSGGGSWDSGSSWDSDSSWDSYDYGYSSGDSSLPGGIVVVIIIIGIAIYIYTSKYNKNSGSNVYPHNISIEPVVNDNLVESKIKAIDELFNKEEFIAYTKNVFVKLQEAWTARDWNTVRTFETNDLFEQHKRQLQGYIDNKQINVMERICVLSVGLESFQQNADKDVLSVILKSRMNDYIIDEDSKKILKGDKTTDRYSTYRMIFIRKTGIKTKPGEIKINTTNCPNCGAPTQITSSGKCEYCGSVITTGEFNWALSNLEKIQ